MPWCMGDPGGKPGRIDMGGNQLAEPVVAVMTLARLGGGWCSEPTILAVSASHALCVL